VKNAPRRKTKAVRRAAPSRRSVDVSRAVRETRAWLRSAGVRASAATTRAYQRAVGFGKESPETIALIALGAGVGIGVLCQRQLRRRRPRGALSRLARAMAEAVFDRR
jgi:hypothetical protein